jgi:hypothetical protein
MFLPFGKTVPAHLAVQFTASERLILAVPFTAPEWYIEAQP